MAKFNGDVSKVKAVFERVEKQAEKLLSAATEEQAKAALKEWRAMFSVAGKRKTLKKAKPKENPYFVWDVRADGGPARKISTVADFKKAVKRDRRKGTGFQGRDVGATSRLRESRYDAKIDALKTKRVAEDPDFIASGESLDSDFAAKKKKKIKSVAWLDAALKDGYDGFVKESASAPGDYPITWKRPAAARGSFPDYYLRASMRLQKVDAATWELVLKPFFTSGVGKDVLKTLEIGGTIRKKRRRVLIGYTVVYYRLISPGRKGKRLRQIVSLDTNATGKFGGGLRRKVEPRYETPVETASIAARPFLAALKKRIDADKLKYLK